MSIICPKCGYQNDDGGMFCIECGAKLNGQPNNQPTGAPLQYGYQQYAYPETKPKNNTGLIVGFVTGGIALIAAVVIVITVLMPMLKTDGKNVDSAKSNVSSDTEGYYPHTDYLEVDWSTIEYADENTAKDFSYTDGWKTMSASAMRITDFSSVTGFWKAVMISDPENKTSEGKFTDYFNVEISGSADDVDVVLNWNIRNIEATGEKLDLKAVSGGLKGSFSNGTVTAEETNKIELTDFWSDNGTEYAVGKFIWSDGTEGYIGLTRH